MKTNKNPVPTARLILDTLHILFQKGLEPVKPCTMVIAKKEIPFIQDSNDKYTKITLNSTSFLNDLLKFSVEEKDNINEETIELLEPYLTLKFPDTGEDIFVPAIAKKASNALAGMCVWAAAMSDYHKQSKIVKPKLILLNLREE